MILSLIHLPSDRKVEDVTKDEAKALIKILGTELLKQWYIEIDANTKIPLTLKFFENSIEELSEKTVEFELEYTRVDHRKQKRFDRQFQFLALSQTTTFETQTVDISSRGIKLREPIPREFPEYFDATVVFGLGQSIDLKVRLITPKKLQILEIDNPAILNQWLLK